MKFEFTGRHIQVTPALKSHVEQHFQRISHLFDGKPARAHVIIEVERGRHRAEIVLTTKNDVFTATSVKQDMYQSLADTISKLEKQALKKRKRKIDEHQHPRISKNIGTNDTSLERKRIVNARRYSIKPISVEEAALQLEAETNQFLVFRNIETHKVAVIYKRKDGNYGLIQPE
ncbi:MAG TPA: ribosome-associated translation inhibitor RaiA [Pyrinomonadaceae bacterium]|jgi:putative sigma-54 modulation protein|nr:ribosome-associated translation inhibitor RaiA [Pyrinomonadaceae bacterium]